MQHDVIVYSLTILLFLVISAFFSAAETALTAVSRARIYQLVKDGNKRAIIVSRLKENKELMISTALLGNNAVNIAASVIATSLSIILFGQGEGLVFTTLVMTFLVVVFCEVIPKTYAIRNAEPASLLLAKPLSWCMKLAYPVTKSIQLFINGIFALLNITMDSKNARVSGSDVVRGTIELQHREGQMVKQEKDMLGSILDLNTISVAQIMVHRKQAETLDADLPVETLVNQAVTLMHSRIPLWKNEPDNIIGLLHVKNLIRLLNESKYTQGGKVTSDAILAICTKPWFIPETTCLRDQLLAFRNARQHFAFVVDEYGAWQGVVTLEDIIEEIVGDIEDEHDEGQNGIQRAGDGSYYIDGSLPLRDLNRRLDWDLPDGDASTAAGLLIHAAETIPPVGASFNVRKYRFTVIAKDATHIIRLRIDKLPEASAPNNAID